jgi:hypothetical protein
VDPGGGAYVALTSGFDLALIEEPDGLLVKLLLATGVLATLQAFVLVVVAGLLHHHEILLTTNRARLTRGYTCQLVFGLQECNIPVRIW